MTNGARIVVDESNRNEDNVSYDHMPLYEEDKSELGLREFIQASEDDEDEFYGKRDIWAVTTLAFRLAEGLGAVSRIFSPLLFHFSNWTYDARRRGVPPSEVHK